MLDSFKDDEIYQSVLDRMGKTGHPKAWEEYHKRRTELLQAETNQLIALFDIETDWGYCAKHLKEIIKAMEK